MTNQSDLSAAYIEACQDLHRAKAAPTGLVLLLGESDFLKLWYVKQLRTVWGDQAPISDLTYNGQLENTVQQLAAPGDLFSPVSGWIVQGCDARLCERLSSLQQQRFLTNLVLCQGVKGFNAKLLAIAKQSGCMVVIADEPTRVQPFITLFCDHLKLRLSNASLRFLSDTLKSDVGALFQTLNFLSLIYATADRVLEPIDIAEHCNLVRDEDAFALRNLLLAKKMDQAVLLVEQLLANRESPLAILGLIVKHFRTALNVRYLHAEGRAQDISRQLNLYGANIQRYTQYSRQLSQQNLQLTLQACGHADQLLKSSPIPSGLILTRVLQSF